MSEYLFRDNFCWVCGKSKEELSKENIKLTEHHTIPKTFNPKKNVVISVCEKCHEEFNKQDIGQMFQFSAKLFKSTQELVTQVAKLNNYVENNFKIKIKAKYKNNKK